MSSPLSHSLYKSVHNPLRGEVRGAYFRFNQSQSEIARQTGLDQLTISRIITDPTSRRAGHHPKKLETRGRKPVFTENDI